MDDDITILSADVARQVGKPVLTLAEQEEVYEARAAAIRSYELYGITTSPSRSVVWMCAWLLTQQRLYQSDNGEARGGHR